MQAKILKEERIHGTHFFPVAVYEQHQPPEIMIVDFHWHDEWEFLWVKDGCGHFQIDDQRHLLHPGCLMLIPGRAVHGGIPLSGQSCSFRAVVFHPHILGGAATDMLQAKFIEPFLIGNSHFPEFFEQDSILQRHLTDILEKIFHLCHNKNLLGYELQVKSQLLLLWSELLASHYFTTLNGTNREKRQQNRLKAVLTYIYEHYNQPISNHELANHMGVSDAYFCRFFKRIMQMTPVEYIQRCRIKSAAGLLRKNQSLPIIDIAYNCGFNNLSYFNLIFKKLLGCTPTEYKNK